MYKPYVYFLFGVLFITTGVLQFYFRQQIKMNDFVLLKGHLRAKVEVKTHKSSDKLVVKVYEYPKAEFYTFDKSVIANKEYLFKNMYSEITDWTEDSVMFHVLSGKFGSVGSSGEIYSLSNYKKVFFDLRSSSVGDYVPSGTGIFLAVGLIFGSIFILRGFMKFRKQISKQGKVNN